MNLFSPPPNLPLGKGEGLISLNCLDVLLLDLLKKDVRSILLRLSAPPPCQGGGWEGVSFA